MSRNIKKKLFIFFIFFVFFFSVLWVIPNSLKLIGSDYWLMMPKDRINKFINKEIGIDRLQSELAAIELHLKRAKSVDPQNPNVNQYLGNLYIIKSSLLKNELYASQELLLTAADYYQEALKIKPVNPVLWVNYANILYAVIPDSTDYKNAYNYALEFGANEQYLMNILKHPK